MRRVAIVGAGVTGLSAAYHLERLSDCEVHLFERGRIGGKVATFLDDPWVVEAGADSIFTRRPGCLELIEELGLTGELVTPQANAFSMLIGGKLWPIGHALVAFGAVDNDALARAEFLSERSKREVAAEEHAPCGTGSDESIASFFRRRYGREFSEKVVEPLLAGTHSGLPDELSMQALYANYLQMEREHGSLTAAIRHAPPPQKGPTFVSFRNGMGVLADRLRACLKAVSVHLQSVTTLSKVGKRYRIEELDADAVILAVPAFEAASILAYLAPRAAELLEGIEVASNAIVTLGYHSRDLAGSLEGTGFLVPYTEKSQLSGATFSSSKWPGRAPESSTLIRAFLGRKGVLDVDAYDDEALQRFAVNGLRPLLPLPEKPDYVRIQRWNRASPQYRVGHCDLMARIENELDTGLYLAGQFYRGAGIPDCLRQGKEAAEKLG